MRIKLGLCVPSYGAWSKDFGYCFAQLNLYCAGNLFEENEARDVVWIDKRTSNLPRSRHECLEDALLQECTHVLFIDTDQTFPADTAHRLIRAKKHIVAANIPLKILPSWPTARARGAGPFGSPIYSNTGEQMENLEKVWRVGAGIMMIDMAIMKSVPKPWFEIRWSDKHNQMVGEDWFFCAQVEKAGFEIWIDHSLSREIGHVGEFQYTHAHIPYVREEAAA